MIKRLIRHYTRTQFLAKINNAYRVFLGGDIEQDSLTAEQIKDLGQLVRMDITGFAHFGEHPANTAMNHDEMLIIEGRRQMAFYMLRHLDIDSREIVETLNDVSTQNEGITDD